MNGVLWQLMAEDHVLMPAALVILEGSVKVCNAFFKKSPSVAEVLNISKFPPRSAIHHDFHDDVAVATRHSAFGLAVHGSSR